MEAVKRMVKLTAAAKEMGATTPFSASHAAKALNYLATAGYTADQSIQALPQWS
jgi:TP901 family phage tail tape measure protein